MKGIATPLQIAERILAITLTHAKMAQGQKQAVSEPTAAHHDEKSPGTSLEYHRHCHHSLSGFVYFDLHLYWENQCVWRRVPRMPWCMQQQRKL